MRTREDAAGVNQYSYTTIEHNDESSVFGSDEDDIVFMNGSDDNIGTTNYDTETTSTTPPTSDTLTHATPPNGTVPNSANGHEEVTATPRRTPLKRTPLRKPGAETSAASNVPTSERSSPAKPATPLRRGTPLSRRAADDQQGWDSPRRRNAQKAASDATEPRVGNIEYVDDNHVVELDYKKTQQREEREAPVAKGRGRRRWELGARQQMRVGKFEVPLWQSMLILLVIGGIVVGIFVFANFVRINNQQGTMQGTAPPSQENVQIRPNTPTPPPTIKP